MGVRVIGIGVGGGKMEVDGRAVRIVGGRGAFTRANDIAVSVRSVTVMESSRKGRRGGRDLIGSSSVTMQWDSGVTHSAGGARAILSCSQNHGAEAPGLRCISRCYVECMAAEKFVVLVSESSTSGLMGVDCG